MAEWSALDSDPTTLENKGLALTASHGLCTSSSLHAHTLSNTSTRGLKKKKMTTRFF